MNESQVFGISVRGWITVIMVSTVCAMAIMKINVTEPLYSLVTMAVGFFLGQKTNKIELSGNSTPKTPIA